MFWWVDLSQNFSTHRRVFPGGLERFTQNVTEHTPTSKFLSWKTPSIPCRKRSIDHDYFLVSNDYDWVDVKKYRWFESRYLD